MVEAVAPTGPHAIELAVFDLKPLPKLVQPASTPGSAPATFFWPRFIGLRSEPWSLLAYAYLVPDVEEYEFIPANSGDKNKRLIKHRYFEKYLAPSLSPITVPVDPPLPVYIKGVDEPYEWDIVTKSEFGGDGYIAANVKGHLCAISVEYTVQPPPDDEVVPLPVHYNPLILKPIAKADRWVFVKEPPRK